VPDPGRAGETGRWWSVAAGLRAHGPPARALGTELVAAEACSKSDIETAFATFVQRGTGGLIIGPYALFDANNSRVLELAPRNKIPAMYR
jgi:hypothetical protein